MRRLLWSGGTTTGPVVSDWSALTLTFVCFANNHLCGLFKKFLNVIVWYKGYIKESLRWKMSSDLGSMCIPHSESMSFLNLSPVAHSFQSITQRSQWHLWTCAVRRSWRWSTEASRTTRRSGLRKAGRDITLRLSNRLLASGRGCSEDTEYCSVFVFGPQVFIFFSFLMSFHRSNTQRPAVNS